MMWEHTEDLLFTDMILVGIYTGLEPIELINIKNENIHLEEGYIIGGTKTKAGTNRIVPIKSEIKSIIVKKYNPNNQYLFNDYNAFKHEYTPLLMISIEVDFQE